MTASRLALVADDPRLASQIHAALARAFGREALLTDLRVRIRDVRQGPDEFLYVVTDEDAGELLRLEPDDEPGEDNPQPQAFLVDGTVQTRLA